ncbi:aldo/keto reductase [Ferrigenium kumadai]|uniref:Aldo/keto reductase n=1 Tax=Ferrigenium kumadai TaxID=1682490 RepID=A0AAN1T0U7_9PROT|nr:aldo/keto reductase [Ferrigenium kumadai]BBJ00661.1 aldo/keto reductase [Ferrigenium kumadai]
MRLALGTAQFGLSYGVANSIGQVSGSAAAEILEKARGAGIDTLDTAIAYGDSEARLGQIGVSGWKVVSKLPPLPSDVVDVDSWLEGQLVGSRKRLNIDRLDALLLHRPADLLGKHGAAYCNALRDMRDRGFVSAVGFSIYTPAELDQLWGVFKPDLVQAPFNILDRRLVDSGWLYRMHQEGVRVHTRSAFLQGLLLMQSDGRPAWFKPWKSLLDHWLSECLDMGKSPLEVALGFVLSYPEIERVVVGVDSLTQFNAIVAAAHLRLDRFPDVGSDDLELIDPTRWRIN